MIRSQHSDATLCNMRIGVSVEPYCVHPAGHHTNFQDDSSSSFQKKAFHQVANHERIMLAGLTSEERVSVDTEEPGLLSPRFEGVRLTDLNLYEARLYQHRPPAFARKAAGDSSSPKVDISYRTLRHRLTVGDIAEL
jgi:hypothetical protein